MLPFANPSSLSTPVAPAAARAEWSKKHWYSVAASWNAAEAARASPAFSSCIPRRKARSASPVAVEIDEDTWRDVLVERIDDKSLVPPRLLLLPMVPGGEMANSGGFGLILVMAFLALGQRPVRDVNE